MEKYNISILGGTSGFGKWLAEFLINNFKNSVDITITGIEESKGFEVADSLGIKYLKNNIEATQTADILVLSVPISQTLDTINEVLPKVKKGTIVADVTSVKKYPTELMYKLAPEGVLIIPTHPMFGPYVKTITSQIFVLTPNETTKNDTRYGWFKDFLVKSGANVYETSPQEHDKMMAVVQGLTHFNLFTFGETIKRLNFDIGFSQNFISPIYKIITASVSRYLSQYPGLYAEIQMNNPEILNVHEKFIESAKDFNNFVKNKDNKKFCDTISECSKHFGERTDEGQKYTDKIIYLMSMQINKINKYVGDFAVFENIYTKSVIEGKIIEFKNNIIYLENNINLNIDEWIIL